MQQSIESNGQEHAPKKRKITHIEKVERDTSLPIFLHRDELISSVRRNPTTIVSGETGSGNINIALNCFI
jgi:HrpA-like RNA helicase